MKCSFIPKLALYSPRKKQTERRRKKTLNINVPFNMINCSAVHKTLLFSPQSLKFPSRYSYFLFVDVVLFRAIIIIDSMRLPYSTFFSLLLLFMFMFTFARFFVVVALFRYDWNSRPAIQYFDIGKKACLLRETRNKDKFKK